MFQNFDWEVLFHLQVKCYDGIGSIAIVVGSDKMFSRIIIY